MMVSNADIARLYDYYRTHMGPATPLRAIMRAMAEDLDVSVFVIRYWLQRAGKTRDLAKVGGVGWDEVEERDMEEVFDALRRKHPDKSRMEIAEMVSQQLLPHRTVNTIYYRYWQVKSQKGEIVTGDVVASHYTGSPSRPSKAYADYLRRRDQEMIAKYANSIQHHDRWEDMPWLCYRKRVSKCLSIEIGSRRTVRWERRSLV